MKQDASHLTEIQLAIDGMTCASCVNRVEKKLGKLPGVTASVNLATNTALVKLGEGAPLDETAYIDAVERAGYKARVIYPRGYDDTASLTAFESSTAEDSVKDVAENSVLDTAEDSAKACAKYSANNATVSDGVDNSDAETRRTRDIRRRFYVSLVLSVPIVAMSMVPALQFDYWQWIAGALAIPVATWCAWPFHISAARSLRHRSTTMDTLISMGVIAAMLWSIWAIFWGGAGSADYRMTMSGMHSLGSVAGSGAGSVADAHISDLADEASSANTHVANMAHAMAPHLHWETAAMIVTFLLLGRWMEVRSTYNAGSALRALLTLGATSAHRVQLANGTRVDEIVPASAIQRGDIFTAKPGESIPTDGVVVEGHSAVDASMLTGESAPIDVSEGAEVTGATINISGSLHIRATRVGKDTTLAQMGRALQHAQSVKAPAQKLADKISSVFVPAVITIAVLTFIVRMFLGHSVELSLTTAMTILVVACPCALGLATPVALMVGSGRAAQKGALIHGPDILESAHKVNTIVLDKTGTLTTAKMAVHEIITAHSLKHGADSEETRQENSADSKETRSENHPVSLENEKEIRLLAVAAGLESHSEHPIARAITASAKERGITPVVVANFENVAGRGIKGVGTMNSDATATSNNTVNLSAQTSNNTPDALETQETQPAHNAQPTQAAPAPISMGNIAWMKERGVELGDTEKASDNLAHRGMSVVVVEENGVALGVIGVRDTVRTNSADVIKALKDMGIEPVLASGDNAPATEAVARELGIARVHAHVLPEDKERIVAELQAENRHVAMVGDGVNDAAALARADLSIAMGSGTDVAKATSDIVVVNSDVAMVPSALRLSSRTLRVIRENLGWAFAYNAVAIPAAVAGIVLPGLAAAAMASSSVIVVLNSLRLRRA